MTQKLKENEAISFTESVLDKYGLGQSGIIYSYNVETGLYDIKSAGELIKDVPEDHIEPVYSSTKKDVDEILREKEKNKEFKDSDIRVGGTKKEQMAFKGLITSSDLDSLEKDNVLAESLIKKDKVYPKLNIEEQKQKNVSGGALYLKVKLRESCSSKPPNRVDARNVYVKYIEYVCEQLDEVKTIKEFEETCNSIIDSTIKKVMYFVNPDIENIINQQTLEIQQEILNKEKYLEQTEFYESLFIEELGFNWRMKQEFGHITDPQIKEKIEKYKQIKNKLNEISRFEESKILPIEKQYIESVGGKYFSSYSYKTISLKVIEEVFGKKFSNFLGKKSDSVFQHYELAFNYEYLDEEESNKLVQEYIKPQEAKIEKFKIWKRNLTDESKSPEERIKYAMEQTSLSSWILKGRDIFNYKPTSLKDQYEKGNVTGALYIINELIIKPNNHYEKVIKETEEKINSLREKYKIRDNDYSWTEEPTDKKVIKRTDISINSGIPLSYIKRTGGVAIYDFDLDTGDKVLSFYKNILGINGVTYGNYLKDDERAVHAKHFAGAIIDICDILDWDIKDFTSLGDLKIKFAASGKGNAMAHYEPSRAAINLTRRRGDGTVAHELMHYIDDQIENKFRKDNQSIARHASFASYDLANNVSNENINKAFKAILFFIKNGVGLNSKGELLNSSKINPFLSDAINESLTPLYTIFAEEIIKNEVEVKITKSDKYKIRDFDKSEKIEDFLEKVKIKNPDYFFYKKYTESKSVRDYFSAILNTFDVDEMTINFKTSPNFNSNYLTDRYTKTMFYINSSEMSTIYWTFPWELIARSFEMYISQKLAKKGRENNYLVSGGYFDSPYGIYPLGTEADILYVLFDHLFYTIKKELHIKDFNPFREDRVNEYVIINNDIENERKIINDTKTNEVVESNPVSIEIIDVLRNKLAQIYESILTSKIYEKGGNINSYSLLNELRIFAYDFK